MKDDCELSRRTLLGYIAMASGAVSALALEACRPAHKAPPIMPTLHVDGIHDDSPALNHLLSGEAVIWNGRRVQFNRRPPPGSYFLDQPIIAPAGSVLTSCVFYAWTRPAIVLQPGALFSGCWTCLSPDPFITGRYVFGEGVVRL